MAGTELKKVELEKKSSSAGKLFRRLLRASILKHAFNGCRLKKNGARI